MSPSEIEAASAAFETAAARGEYFPKAWADRLAFAERHASEWTAALSG